MPLQQITAPTAEPISRAQAKQQLRAVTGTAEDAFLDAVIAAARAACETRTQNQIVAARWKLVLDSFPGPSLMGVPYGKPYGLPEHAILIPKGPVLQIVSIQYTDTGGVVRTLVAGTDYVVDLSSSPARITPPFGAIWPVTLPQIGAVVVTFDAGHAAPLVADAAADTIAVPGWKILAVNDAIRVSNRDELATADGSFPAPLAANTDFYVRTAPGNNLYTLSATSGGGLLDLTTAGAGKSFIGEIPGALRAWMMLAIGTLYQNRESVSVDSRITQVELPEDFREGLLDPYRIVLY
jgi:uncharacterized phiE125 gp8 family phage protein